MVHVAAANRGYAIPGKGYRCNPVSSPSFPMVGSRVSGTFAMGYGSDLLPLRNALLLQAVDLLVASPLLLKGNLRRLSRA
jgi:hypothetical protein